jgi:hypothetical protein
MTIHDGNLGGRLRLLNPAEMPASQKSGSMIASTPE